MFKQSAKQFSIMEFSAKHKLKYSKPAIENAITNGISPEFIAEQLIILAFSLIVS